MKFYSAVFALLFCINLSAQTVVTTTPLYPTETDQITIRFDVSNTNPAGKTPLINYTGDVYAHTGVYVNNDNSTWKYVIGTWGQNGTQPKATFLSSNVYQIVINNPRTYYGVGASEKVTSLNFVLRSSDGTKQTEDIKIPLYSSGFSVVLTAPTLSGGLGDPMRTPAFVQSGGTLDISATTTGTATSIKLLVNGTQITQTSSNSLSYSFAAANFPAGRNDIKITAVDNLSRKDSVQFVVMSTPAINSQAPPPGTQIGINYGSDPTKVTLAFYAPKKNFVYVVGEFGNTDWKVDNTLFMNKYTPKADSVIWWTTISGLESGKEYSYQFLVDGTLRIYDPYTEKILDANNDPYIPASVYPNLKAYPTGKTSGLVSVLQTNQTYNWNVSQFTRPAKEKLIVYELLVRDFVTTHSYAEMLNKITYLKRLGINAVELMPVMEFEGNDSWGYNPTTYFAPDKYYGTKNALKAFIDACHQNGIAVILDIVLNHAYNSNSMVQLYWDSANSRPSIDNPWFNVVPPANSYAFGGSDFNHESKDTKYFVDRVTSFWMTEYKADGFRFDFSKGFTNTAGDGSAYDARRIAILERIASKMWTVSPTSYVILEHFGANSEEIELSNYTSGGNGIMLWGNLNGAYSNAVSGITTSNFNNIAYSWRGMSNPAIVGYMESHDEERVMANAISNGFNVASGTFRTGAAASLFILVPGPKMIWQFGELGYDYSINYGGRLGDKPIKWEYYDNDDRKNLYYKFAYLNGLKKNYPVFSSTDFTLTANFLLKSLYLNHSSMNAAVFANFDLVARDYQTQFQSTGTWYEFFSGQTLNVTDVNMTINLQPGEYRLYTSQYINKSDVVTGIQNESSVPKDYSLSQNYPNPFNPSTVIRYSIPNAGNVTLKVYDMLGREVVTLVNGYQSAGSHTAQFSIQNSQLASGIYLYRIQAGTFTSSKKMVLIK